MGTLIEKVFEGGRAALDPLGVPVESLADLGVSYRKLDLAIAGNAEDGLLDLCDALDALAIRRLSKIAVEIDLQ